MSTKAVVVSSMARIRRMLRWVALAAGRRAAAMAEPTEDLIDAACRGDAAAVQALLAKGADVNARMNGGRTALIMASEQGHVDVVQALLAEGADVNWAGNGGCDSVTALIVASERGHLDVVQALLANGADVNAVKGSPWIWTGTALHAATAGGHADVVRALLAKGADVNAKDNRARPLDAAGGHAVVRALLVQAGAKP